jgi:protein-S-isoprenylcysteine O-methyltransferase Ste14
MEGIEIFMLSTLITTITFIWIAFEISLVVRDRIQGKGRTGNDRGTRYFNFIAIFVGITVAGVLSGNTRFFFLGSWSNTVFWIGLFIIVLGFILRIWSVVTLGALFRTTIETHTGQHVVRNGPYRLVRHPSYSGGLLMCFGYGIAFQNWLSLAFAVLLPLAAFVYRIHFEEAALVSSIGSDYIRYQSETKKLIPWIW